VKYGLELAPWGDRADPRVVATLAETAEAAGWHGMFVWDAMLYDEGDLPKADAWITLAAMAAATARIRIGPMVTPLARRRPWKVAREAVTLDYLSNGRLTLGVGLGDPSLEEFEWFGERGRDHTTRARMLDEALKVLRGLWSGEPFELAGEFYDLREMRFRPRPLQTPGPPVWVGARWPSLAPVRRAARWDGINVGRVDGPMTPDDVRNLIAYIGQHRTNGQPLDVVVTDQLGSTQGPQLRKRLRELEEAGATWWLVKAGTLPTGTVDAMLREGPPR
jgi:alkanesulfonate monooxygenase SsuD/methylene tetrahydromethanopterin reductase-like flavin-dependent oxidoreductase (luciferase family)